MRGGTQTDGIYLVELELDLCAEAGSEFASREYARIRQDPSDEQFQTETLLDYLDRGVIVA